MIISDRIVKISSTLPRGLRSGRPAACWPIRRKRHDERRMSLRADRPVAGPSIAAGKWRELRSRRSVALARLSAAYGAFALLSTAVNLWVQWATVRLATPLHLLAPRLLVVPALAIGTGAGLAVKYTLDKRFIFRDRLGGALHLARNFGLYAVMGLATTGLFWGAELLSCLLSSDPHAMYLGGGVGLAIGYVVKYRLDRRFVFTQASSDAEAEAGWVTASPQRSAADEMLGSRTIPGASSRSLKS